MSRCSCSCEDGAGSLKGLILSERRPGSGSGRPLRPASATPPGEADAKGRTKAHRLKATAYHEAGHANMAVWCSLRFHHVTIVPDADKGSLGHILYRIRRKGENFYYESLNPRLGSWVEKQVLCLYAGGLAERKFTGRRNLVGARSDRHQAYDYGLLLYRAPILKKYLAFMLSRAEDLICGPLIWPHVELVAADLLKHGTLTEEQVYDVKHRGLEGLSVRGGR